MVITEREHDGVVVLEIRGRLTMNDGRGALKAAVDRLVARGVTRVVLNLEGLQYLDSACLGELIQAHAALCRREGRLKLARVPQHLGALLRLAGLDGVFEICDSEAEAVASFPRA
jgi:anti-sigma B factor antagonist